MRSYLPASHSQEEAEDIGLLLFLQLLHIFEGTHLEERASVSITSTVSFNGRELLEIAFD